MGLLECASGQSAWRGYEYYLEKRVTNVEKIYDNAYSGKVLGSSKSSYITIVDIEHPRKSACSCPHANGKRIICKHIVALYFTVNPAAAKNYYEACIEAEKEAEKQQDEIEEKVIACVHSMKKNELAATFLEYLFDGPEWQYDKFVREHIDWD